jgi:hypothetical protein
MLGYVTPVSSTNKPDNYDATEILLIVVLNTINIKQFVLAGNAMFLTLIFVL